MIDQERLIYCHKPYTKYRWLAYVSLIQAGFVAINLIFLPTPKLVEQRQKSRRKRDETRIEPDLNIEEKDSSTWRNLKDLNYRELFTLRNIYGNMQERPYLCIGMLGVSVLVLSVSTFYTRRLAHKITLLPNDRVRFASFSPLALGKPPTVELHLRDVSCVAGRNSDKNYSILKFKGYLGYHLVNKTEGTFIEPHLYDEYLGYARSWMAKN